MLSMVDILNIPNKISLSKSTQLVNLYLVFLVNMHLYYNAKIFHAFRIMAHYNAKALHEINDVFCFVTRYAKNVFQKF